MAFSFFRKFKILIVRKNQRVWESQSAEQTEKLPLVATFRLKVAISGNFFQVGLPNISFVVRVGMTKQILGKQYPLCHERQFFRPIRFARSVQNRYWVISTRYVYSGEKSGKFSQKSFTVNDFLFSAQY